MILERERPTRRESASFFVGLTGDSQGAILRRKIGGRPNPIFFHNKRRFRLRTQKEANLILFKASRRQGINELQVLKNRQEIRPKFLSLFPRKKEAEWDVAAKHDRTESRTSFLNQQVIVLVESNYARAPALGMSLHIGLHVNTENGIFLRMIDGK